MVKVILWSRTKLAFYQQTLGMTVLEHEDATAILGVSSVALLSLSEIPGARSAPVNTPGLYHFAILLPTRSDLARWVKHAASLGIRIGQSDHLVSEAFYLSDPDGHGIEMYRDRPRSEWKWDLDQIRMASDPIDIPNLLNEPGADEPFHLLPEGTTMGHVHLRVTDLAATEAFYRGTLGFDVVARWPGALFVSVGGYHHHFGLNVWHSQGGSHASESTAKLERVWVSLPNETEVNHLQARLQADGIAFSRNGNRLEVQDPSGNLLRFTVKESLQNAQTAAGGSAP